MIIEKISMILIILHFDPMKDPLVFNYLPLQFPKQRKNGVVFVSSERIGQS